MRPAVLFVALVAILSIASACELTSFDSWESDFDLSTLQIPTIIKTVIRFNSDGSFLSATSYRDQCFVAVNGSYVYTAPFLDFTAVASDPEPNPTSVSCQLLDVASSAIGADTFLPPANITFSADCKTFNMTFLDNVGLSQTRLFMKGSALVLIPSLVLIALAAIVQFL